MAINICLTGIYSFETQDVLLGVGAVSSLSTEHVEKYDNCYFYDFSMSLDGSLGYEYIYIFTYIHIYLHMYGFFSNFVKLKH